MSNKFGTHALHESITQTMKALKKAQKYAENSRDIEALVVISERWMGLIQRIDAIDNPTPKMIGFTMDNQGDSEDE